MRRGVSDITAYAVVVVRSVRNGRKNFDVLKNEREKIMPPVKRRRNLEMGLKKRNI